MSWLVPSLPSLPGWSRSTPAGPSTTPRSAAPPPPSNMDEPDEDDLDVPPPFPLLDSHQRSQAPPAPTPTFAVSAPSPPGSDVDDGEAPSELNIAILKDPIPLGNMAPPPSTTQRPAFGIQKGGSDEGAMAAPPQPTKTTQAKGKKGKVALGPGFSALDWNRLTKSGKDLTGTGGQFMRVTIDELKKHNTREDAWSSFNGKVYNITPYLPYHPGGVDELMRVAGRDGTKLFMLTHSWVNMDYMLQECMVGMLVRG